jgi:tripartite-type tricarboxylate transporter receptor subunit TctC
LANHIPGNPTVIVENRPGAGSLVAANLVYSSLPQDGTIVANIHPQLMFQQLMGGAGIEFDGSKYQWLGSLSAGRNACAIHKDTGVTELEQIMGADGRTVKMGGEAPGSGVTDATAVMRAALDLKFRIIYGYKGIAPIARALLSREIDGMCTTWETLIASYKNFFEPERLVNVLVIAGTEVPDHPWADKAVAAQAVAPTEQARRLLIAAGAPRQRSYPYTVGPGVPADRAAALRQAFARMLADEAFIADYQKTGSPLVGRDAEEITSIVNELLSMPPETVASLKEALKRKVGP